METQKKRIIGVTGGVGAGKSTVLALLREKFGADVFLADTCAHELMEPGTRGLEQVGPGPWRQLPGSRRLCGQKGSGPTDLP